MNKTTTTLMAALSLLGSVKGAENLYWAGGATGYCDDPGTWTNATGVAMTPATGDTVTIQGPGGVTATLTNNMELGTSGPLQLGIVSVDGYSEGTLVIEPGARLTSKGVQLGWGAKSNTSAAGTIIQNGGTYSSNASISLGRGYKDTIGRYYMNGGELTCTRLGVWIAYAGGSGYFYQAGGTVTAPQVSIPNKATAGGGAYYEISGGSLTVSDTLSIGIEATLKSAMPCEFRIIGSTSSINVTGTMWMKAPAYVNATLTALVDNNGVSPIDLSGSTTTNTMIAGEFAAGAAYGVAFTSTNVFDVIANSPVIVGSFTTLPDPAIWTTEIVEGDSGFNFRMKLTDSVGDKVFSGNRSLEHCELSPAAAAGHITVNVQSVRKPLPAYLAVDPGAKTVADLIAFLQEGGFDAAASDEAGYDVMFTVTPSEKVSHLVWDLSRFDSAATVSAVALRNTLQPTVIMIF